MAEMRALTGGDLLNPPHDWWFPRRRPGAPGPAAGRAGLAAARSLLKKG